MNKNHSIKHFRILNYFFVIIFLLLCVPAFGQKYKKLNIKKINIVDRQYSRKGEPLNGYYNITQKNWQSERVHFSNGYKNDTLATISFLGRKITGAYVNGLKEGVWKDYMFRINPMIISNYKNDLKDGVEFSSGLNNEDTLHYKAGELDGWQYYNNRYTKKKCFYEQGKRKSCTEHRFDNTLNKDCVYDSATYKCNLERHYKNYTIKEEIIKNGNELNKFTTVNDTVQHLINFKKTIDGDIVSILISFYSNKRKYEAWEFIYNKYDDIGISSSLAENIFGDNSFNTFYSEANNQLYCNLEARKMCEHLSLFFFEDDFKFYVNSWYYTKKSDGTLTENHNKYLLKWFWGSGDMLSGCVSESVNK